MSNFVKLTASVIVSVGGFNYRGALVQADYYRVYPKVLNGKTGIKLQAIKNEYVVFDAFLLMPKKQSILVSDLARNNISNVYNPLIDHDK